MLCFRCEHRARFHEEHLSPRFECGEVFKAVHSCYMFQPVHPILLEREAGDKRPIVGPWSFSARVHRTRVDPIMELNFITPKDKKNWVLLFWSPRKEKNEKGNSRRKR